LSLILHTLQINTFKFVYELRIHTYKIVQNANLHIKFTYVNSDNTNYHKHICTDLLLIDSKKASSFEKRAPPLSPIVEVDNGDEDDDDDEEEEDD
jgi:hypothetical protein